MGAGLSGEDETEGTPGAGLRELNWLLSDAAQVQEAFKPVWAKCDVDEEGCAAKALVLEVLLHQITAFDAGGTASAGGQVASTAGHLGYVVSMMPDNLTQKEALHLFRLALLALQAALAAQQEEGRMAWTAPQLEAAPHQSAGMLYDLSRASRSSPLSKAESASLVQTVRGFAKPEDTVAPTSAPRPSGRLPEPKFVLPSRQELEVESEQLQRLSELIAASARDEASVVKTLEEELRSAGANKPQNVASRSNLTKTPLGSGEAALVKSFETRVTATEERVRHLETAISDKDSELNTYEAEVSQQQTEMKALHERRAHEETLVELLHKETHDLNAELLALRQQCRTAEAEILREEGRAAELRESFENKRLRYMSIEAAAQNAEFSRESVMRRHASNAAAVQREKEALQEAEAARSELASAAHEKIEALMVEIEEEKSRGARLKALLSASEANASRLAPLPDTDKAEVALRTLRIELQVEERERIREMAASHATGSEIAELEVSRARLEGQIAALEGELQSAKRRPASSSLDRSKPAPSSNSTVLQKLNDADLWWQRARELSTELGEARAQLFRKRAEEDSSKGGPTVLAAMQQALVEAERSEAQNRAKLEDLRREVLADKLPSIVEQGQGVPLKASTSASPPAVASSPLQRPSAIAAGSLTLTGFATAGRNVTVPTRPVEGSSFSGAGSMSFPLQSHTPNGASPSPLQAARERPLRLVP